MHTICMAINQSRFSYGETISLNSTVDDSGSEKKGTYEVAIVNENYDPGDTLMSNDSAYDLAKTEVTEARAGSHLMSEGIKSEKKKKKKKKRNDDLIYKESVYFKFVYGFEFVL